MRTSYISSTLPQSAEGRPSDVIWISKDWTLYNVDLSIYRPQVPMQSFDYGLITCRGLFISRYYCFNDLTPGTGSYATEPQLLYYWVLRGDPRLNALY